MNKGNKTRYRKRINFSVEKAASHHWVTDYFPVTACPITFYSLPDEYITIMVIVILVSHFGLINCIQCTNSPCLKSITKTGTKSSHYAAMVNTELNTDTYYIIKHTDAHSKLCKKSMFWVFVCVFASSLARICFVRTSVDCCGLVFTLPLVFLFVCPRP